MTNEKKMELLEEVMDMEAGTLAPDAVLEELEEWNSIAVISFIAMVDDEFDKVINSASLKKQKTVADLLALMEEE